MEDFESHRVHLRAVAYHMLGSASDADDAVQEAWLRLARADPDGIQNAEAWLTTVVARVCLDMLRSRRRRGEVPLDTPLPTDAPDPEQEAMLTDSVGVALLVVLDTLTPPERLAFVLHDVFAVPFGEIAPIVGRSTAATKMLTSRARRRVRAVRPTGTDRSRQQAVVDAFLTASRNGDFTALLELLDPDVAVRADSFGLPPATPTRMRGAAAVARQALVFSRRAGYARTGFVNGVPAIVVAPHGRLATVMVFGVSGDRIVAIDIITDPRRMDRLAIESTGPG